MKKILYFCFVLFYTYNNLFADERSIYARPYNLLDNNIDYVRLEYSNYATLGVAAAVMTGLYFGPESVSKWDAQQKKDMTSPRLFHKWSQHVREGPVHDDDELWLNWIAHPYCGALYYMQMRSAGGNIWSSFGWSVLFSTFFWEYGVEAFAEIPSKQDLFITPIMGSIFGEGFYVAKRYIVNNDYKLLNSKMLGKTLLWLMDPTNEIVDLFYKGDKKGRDDIMAFSYPTYKNDRLGYNIKVVKRF